MLEFYQTRGRKAAHRRDDQEIADELERLNDTLASM
jgi:hypothetical protein